MSGSLRRKKASGFRFEGEVFGNQKAARPRAFKEALNHLLGRTRAASGG